MKKIRAKEQELLDILNRGGRYPTRKLAKELHMNEPEVRRLVKQVRYKYMDGVGTDYIYITENGYTTDENKESTVYESNLRMKVGFGVLVNGSHVFRRARMIAPKAFIGLTVQYKPLCTQKLIGR